VRGRALALACAGALLAGCAAEPRVVEVKVPVPVRTAPPPELTNCTKTLSPPTFEACGPDGWSCLSPDQEARFSTFVHVLLTCDRGWRAWSAKPAP
jgi:hypothetical protein